MHSLQACAHDQDQLAAAQLSHWHALLVSKQDIYRGSCDNLRSRSSKAGRSSYSNSHTVIAKQPTKSRTV